MGKKFFLGLAIITVFLQIIIYFNDGFIISNSNDAVFDLGYLIGYNFLAIISIISFFIFLKKR